MRYKLKHDICASQPLKWVITVLSDDMIRVKNSCVSTCQEVETFFSPLFSLLGIHGFSFNRVYQNQERIFLSNSCDWVTNFFAQDYFRALSYQSYSVMPAYLLWANWPKEDKKGLCIQHDAYANFNYSNALNITRTHDDYIDIFSLRGFVGDSAVNSRYFIHLENINKFLDYFLLKGNDWISKTEKFQVLLSDSDFQEINCLKSALLFNKSQVHKMPFSGKEILHPVSGEPFLTSREQVCLRGLILGMTSKEIARWLCISNRTVEQHLANIKLKMKANTRSEIIRNILKIDFNKNILLFEK